MIQNRSAPPGSIIPHVLYTNVLEAMDWLCTAFGFTERLRAAGEDGTVSHAQLEAGDAGVLLGAARAGEPGQSVTVRVADVDAHHERAKQNGAQIVRPPATYPFGERQYTAEDLEGHRWTFSQAVADVAPEQWGAVVGNPQSRVAQLPRPRFCYLQIPAMDIANSVSFYQNVFGWNIRGRDTARPSFDDATGNISGAWVTGRPISREPGLLAYIWVDDIDATLELIAAEGGEAVEPPHLDSPGGEWIATFRDPAGNVMGLYQEGSRTGADRLG